MMSYDVVADVRRLNAIGDPLLFRIGLAGLLAQYGLDRVRHTLIDESARAGCTVVSIATARNWRQPLWMRRSPWLRTG